MVSHFPVKPRHAMIDLRLTGESNHRQYDWRHSMVDLGLQYCIHAGRVVIFSLPKLAKIKLTPTTCCKHLQIVKRYYRVLFRRVKERASIFCDSFLVTQFANAKTDPMTFIQYNCLLMMLARKCLPISICNIWAVTCHRVSRSRISALQPCQKPW